MSLDNFNNFDFETKLIHAGQMPDKETGALATPIYQTSTFCFDTVEEGASKFSGEIEGYVYSRGGNPTNRALEIKSAAIENGEDCVATASGMGAIGSVMVAFLRVGDHVICGEAVYGGTSVVMRTNLPQFGIEVSFVDTTKWEEVLKAVKPNTKILYYETPTNPTMKITDISKMSEICKKYNIKHVVDNTFSPPPVQFPLNLGADIVVHSVTKYINGHGDTLGGLVIGSAKDIKLVRSLGVTKICGTPQNPLSSFLILRGMKTLALRVHKHCENALKVAEFLSTHKYIASVHYSGIPSHPQHDLATKQMNGFYTGILSFELKNGINNLSSFEAGKKVVNNLKLASIAVSLGDPDTLVQHPASMTHANMPKDAREQAGIVDGLVRLSVGLESANDIINDFAKALDSL